MTEKIGAHLCQHCVGLAAVGHQARRLVERLVDVILEPKKQKTQRAETKKNSTCLPHPAWSATAGTLLAQDRPEPGSESPPPGQVLSVMMRVRSTIV